MAWTLGFLRARAVDRVEDVGNHGYRRVLDTRSTLVAVSVKFGGPGDAWVVKPSRPNLERVVRRLFGLDPDLDAFLTMARADPLLGPLVAKRPGLRIPILPTPFEAAVRAIVGQLISVAAARTVLGRLAQGFGRPLGQALAFPDPASFRAARPDSLRAIGLTTAKARAIRELALADDRGDLDWTSLAANPAEADRTLTALPGIGAWTSQYVRMRGLADPDAFLATDLGIVHALEARGVDRRRVEATAERWRPWRAYAAIHLWASLGD